MKNKIEKRWEEYISPCCRLEIIYERAGIFCSKCKKDLTYHIKRKKDGKK